MTARGAALALLGIACAVAGRLTGAEELVLLAVAVASLLATGYAMMARRAASIGGALGVEVLLQSTEVPVGTPIGIQARLVNRGMRSLPPLLITEQAAGKERTLVAGQAAEKAPFLVTRIPLLGPGDVATVGISIPTAQRGVFTRPSVTVWVEDGFGLFRREVRRGPEVHYLVVPAVREVPLPPGCVHPAPLSLTRLEAGPSDGLGDTGGTEFVGIRPYVPGDRLFRIHWPAIARNGKLLVREFREGVAGEVRVTVDTDPGLSGQQLEEEVGRVASLAVSAMRRGFIVDLVIGASCRFRLPPTAEGRSRLLRVLAQYPAEPDGAVSTAVIR